MKKKKRKNYFIYVGKVICKENYPDWEIPTNSDVSKYWIWVMCRYKDQLKEMYNADAPNIPENWWCIQKEEAIDSL